jgi:spore coat polysaccharide biosynthesis protein SpsF
MLRAVAIVQARTGSTRLPGKALLDIDGQTMLARVVARVQRAQRVDEVVVATTNAPADDAVVSECEQLGVRVFRGSEHDVLSRFAGAAAAFGAGPIVRITSDCPLIDPEVIDEVVYALGSADFAANTLQRTYPQGLDVEVASREALDRTAREAVKPFDREHVFPYVYRHPERFALVSVTSDRDWSSLRWTVDEAEDLEFVRAVHARLGDPSSWRDVLGLVEREPELAEINRGVRQKRAP